MTVASLLEEALELWGFAREGVIDEVKNLPDVAMTSGVQGGRTIAEIVQHIAESGLLMSGELTRPDGDFLRRPYTELLQEHAAGMEQPIEKAKLLALLERTHREGQMKIRAAGESLFLQPIRQFNGKPARRLTWMHHGIGHEEYHRGQIALTARSLGYVPALTKLIHGE